MYQLTKSHATMERVAATSPTRYAISVIRLEPGPNENTGLVVATDGKRLAVRECGREAGDSEPVSLPAKEFAKVLRSVPSCFVSRGDNGRAHIEAPNTAIDIDREDDDFPAWREVLPAEYASAINVDADLLQKMLATVPVSEGGHRNCIIGLPADPSKPLVIASPPHTESPLYALQMPCCGGSVTQMLSHLAACRERLVSQV